jgi:tetratricopeptide (TPR) repeat protein
VIKRLPIFIFILASVIQSAAFAQPASKAIPQYKKANQFAAAGYFLDAISAAKKAVQADRNFDSAQLLLANLYLKVSQNDSAVQVLKKALTKKPKFLEAHILMGNIYRDYIKKPEAAIPYYTTATKIDSTNKETWYSIAWCHNALKNYKEAIVFAEKSLNVDNNYKPAYNEAAHAFKNQEAYEACIEFFKKRIAISVNDLPLYYMGLCYIQLNNKQAAQQVYEQLLSNKAKAAETLKKRLDAMPN